MEVRQMDAQNEMMTLKRESELLREITNHMFDMVSITDLKGRYIWVGKSHEILGYSMEALMKQTVFEKIHPDDLQGVINAFQDFVANQNDGAKVIYRIQKLDGNYLWFETMGKFIKDEEGHSKEILFSSRDITERYQAEEDLRLMVGYSNDFLKLESDHVSYKKITDDFLKLCQGSFAAFNLYEESGVYFKTMAVAGDSKTLNKASEILEFNLNNKQWPHDIARAEKLKGNLTIHFQNLEELAGESLPRKIIQLIERTFDIGEVLVFKVMHQDKMLGDFTLIMDSGKRFAKKAIAEIFCSQLGMVIERLRTNEALKQTQLQLENSEEQFRVLVEELHQGLALHKIICDKDGQAINYRFISVNKAYETLTGLKAEQVIGKTVLDILPRTEKEWIERFGRVALTGKSDKFDNYSEALGKYFKVYAYSPKPNYFAVVIEDVTEEKHTENKLILRDQLLYNLSQQVPGALYQYLLKPDGSSCFPFTSHGIDEIYEVTPEEVKEDATIVFNRIHPEDLEHVKASIRYSAEHLSVWEDQYRVILPLRGERYVLGNARPEKMTDGSILWHGYLRDVTKNKEIEEQVYVEKEHFKTTLLSVGDGIIACDTFGNITVMNPAAEMLTGYTKEEAIGKLTEEVFYIVHEYTREVCENPVEKVLQSGEGIELEKHTMLISKDGQEYIIEDSIAPIKNKKGEMTGAVIVFRDCTEKDEKQKQIQHLSYHDQLTGLYNRHFFKEELSRLDVERNLPFSIAMIDVNGLKLINDAFGHEAGDLLLTNVANVLENECRTDDIISRVGGDEFVILLPKTDHNQADLMVKRIYKAFDNLKVENVIVSVSIGWETKENAHQNIKEVFGKAEDYMYRKKITESQSMRNQTIKVIMHTLHETNPREKLHSERVSMLCRKIGQVMELDEQDIKELEIAGLMHDIGKIAINNDILNKPGKLTDSEFEEIKKHPEISYHILKSADVYTRLAEYVLSHHERWDGKGYPRGLSGEDIPLVSRIITVADAYEAMTAIRTYKEAFSNEKALEELKRCSGTQFDPEIVRAFEQHFWIEN